MAGRGPVPKRLEERRRGERPNAGPAVTQVETFPGQVSYTPADPHWHPIAIGLYESLAQSGQSQFYEPSDWAYAYLLCENLSRFQKGDYLSPSMLGTLLSGFGDLLVTEGDRRRARMELLRPKPGAEERPAGVVAMEAFRARGDTA